MASLLFPAPAGMNRPGRQEMSGIDSVPRASGDEPDSDEAVLVGSRCSPRQRG